MKLLYRFVIFLMAILFMITSIGLAFYGFGWGGQNMLPDLISDFYNQWEMGIVFVLLFIASAWIIYPFFVSESVSTTSISKSDIGNVDITLDALDSLVNNIALEQEGVVAIKNSLKTTEEGLIINLSAKIFPSMSIPNITESLQEMVKSYIEDTTGVTVVEVKVLVEQISKNEEKKVK
ncbi:MAG: alkaline shock response membrane anchor protein AmaP [Halanaerobiales bacterium]